MMRLNEILGTEFPIIQGGMANIATGAFAAAVSNAGAMGLVGSGGMDAEVLRAEIRAARAATDRPFGVNLMLMDPHIDQLAQVVLLENGFDITFTTQPGDNTLVRGMPQSLLGLDRYTVGEDTLFAHLYLEGTVDTGLGWSLSCETGYPHQGEVRYTYHGPEQSTTLALRIPGWSRETTLTVNGEPADLASLTKDGYAYLTRTFREGDRITLTLDMAPQWVTASAKVPAATGCAAVQRGPLVYCAEGVDNSDDVLGLSFRRDGALKDEPFDPALLGGVTPITAQGWRQKDAGGLYAYGLPRPEGTEVRLVPYYAWANRGLTQMRVWLPVG